ncbi:MAG: autotransporter outer membrane beta-barrel domain-containing protein [Hyphomicrobiales bacterium]
MLSRNNNANTSITITTNGTFTGGNVGIFARNRAPGNTSITINNGAVITGTSQFGVFARNDTRAADIEVTSAYGSSIIGNSGLRAINNGSGVISITANGIVTGTGNNGIDVINDGSATDITVITGANSAVTGRNNGITARNRGSGATSITVNGALTGTRQNGINVRGDASTTTLNIATGAGSVINARRYGINSRHFGSGAFTLTANGAVNSTTRAGIFARNYNSAAFTILTGEGSAITGQRSGINARNTGSGIFQVTANGTVTGTTREGLYARNQSGTNLSVTTGINSSIMGNFEGIFARNDGTGSTTVTANGSVNSTTREGIEVRNTSGTTLTVNTGLGSNVVGASDGIYARQAGTGILSSTINGTVTGGANAGVNLLNANGTDLTMTTGTGSILTGNTNGINAQNFGSGSTNITANGVVTGNSADGIYAFNSSDGTHLAITTGGGSSVYGFNTGINAINDGSEHLTIDANGDVTGNSADGIYANNSGNGTYLSITTGVGATVSGNNYGIFANNNGSEHLTIDVNGNVTGNSADGIYAFNSSDGTYLAITTAANTMVSGSNYGIFAFNSGSGAVIVTANGEVSGATFDGIYAYSLGTTLNVTTGPGTVSGSIDGLDIPNYGTGATTISINGNVMGGSGAGADSFTNAGLITLAGNGAPSSATFTNLETFSNAGGAINLQNGVTGDSLTLTDGAGGLSYTGGGVFLTDIGDPNIGDKLIIDGMIASGTTGISATVVNGAGPEGPVDVVEVSNGTSVGDFILAGPVTNTIYEYDLSLNGDGQTWQLIRTGEVVDEVSVAAVLPSILLGDTRQFVGRLEDRMTAARGRGFLPVADIDNPSAAPAAPERFSTWARIEGYAAKDKGTIDATAVDVPARYDENLGFLQGGASATLMDDADGQFIASLFGHYGQSESDVTDVDGDQGQFTIDSYGIAGALTYFSRSGFYGDAMVLYSKHDVKSVSATNTVDKTDGKTLALSFEAGWKIGVSEAFSIIPQAQIVYQYTNIGDLVSANGIDIDFRDGESLEGRFGVTWHYEEPLTQLDKTLRLHMRTDIVHEFKENAVTTVNGVGLGFNQRGTGFELGAGAWMLPVTGRGIKWGAKVDVRTPFDKSKGRRSVAGSALVGVNW